MEDFMTAKDTKKNTKPAKTEALKKEHEIHKAREKAHEEAQALRNEVKKSKALQREDEEIETIEKELIDTEPSKKRSFIYSFQKAWYFFFSQTSAMHRQEAKEKYWILWRELESAMYSRAIELNFSFTGFVNKKPKEVDGLIKAFLYKFKSLGCNEKSRTFSNLLLYARILSKQPLDMLNKADELNMVWRDITFVRSRLLIDNIIPDERLSAHLEYCRLECEKICPPNEDKIAQMCHETALEIVDSNESSNGDVNKKARKTIALILAKLNDIRLNDINTQLRIKKIYDVAFIFLAILSLLLLHLNEVITGKYEPDWFFWHQFIETFEFTNPASWIMAPLDFTVSLLHNNLLFFIFFAGLLGGFFSTVMRLRSKKVNITDVYLRSYLLTKPIVGALGAVILYIIITSKIMPIDIGQLKLIDRVSENTPMFGPLGFAFGFIMGFSERIILPTITSESRK
jgi:hypothetical protein